MARRMERKCIVGFISGVQYEVDGIFSYPD